MIKQNYARSIAELVDSIASMNGNRFLLLIDSSKYDTYGVYKNILKLLRLLKQFLPKDKKFFVLDSNTIGDIAELDKEDVYELNRIIAKYRKNHYYNDDKLTKIKRNARAKKLQKKGQRMKLLNRWTAWGY